MLHARWHRIISRSQTDLSRDTTRIQKWRRRCAARSILKQSLKAIKDGTIDAIATDHAPHHADEKALEYDRAPFGITGLETSIGLAMTELVHKGIISLERFVELCSTNPAKILRLEGRGTLKAGSVADITILDPDREWTYINSGSRSKSRNSPFDGREFRGAVVATIVGGRFVFKR